MFPHVDASLQRGLASISDEHAQFFRDNGLLVLRNVLCAEELRLLQLETQVLVNTAARDLDDPDFFYREHELTRQRVPFRVEFVIDKLSAARALLGHPFILRSIEKLQGGSFIPTWDSMVFKQQGMGASIPWHRDSPPYGYPGIDERVAAINVDFYLDRSDLSNCLWGILGSNHWPVEQVERRITELNSGLKPRCLADEPDVVPIPMEPGDVLFHSTLVLHGSQPSLSHLRRVLYYEFRPGEVERQLGPHTEAYIPQKQRLLNACLRDRASTPYAQGELPFAYHPAVDLAAPPLAHDERLASYRFAHCEYLR